MERSDISLVDEAVKNGTMLVENRLGVQIHYCVVCSVSMTGKVSACAHLKGMPHMKREKSGCAPSPNEGQMEVDDFSLVDDAVKSGIMRVESTLGTEIHYCVVCDVSMTGEAPACAHLKGMSHIKRVKSGIAPLKSGITPPPNQEALSEAINRGTVVLQSSDGKDEYFCTVCRLSCNSCDQVITHLVGKNHVKKIKFSTVAYDDVNRHRTSGPIVCSVSPIQVSDDSRHSIGINGSEQEPEELVSVKDVHFLYPRLRDVDIVDVGEKVLPLFE